MMNDKNITSKKRKKSQPLYLKTADHLHYRRFLVLDKTKVKSFTKHSFIWAWKKKKGDKHCENDEKYIKNIKNQV